MNKSLPLYETYMDELLGVNWWVEKKVEKKKFKFNPNATVFVPRVIYGEACQKESPPKPEGPAPEKLRPISSSKGDLICMGWNLYEQTDTKLVEIERKLQALINLQGPVVHAQQI